MKKLSFLLAFLASLISGVALANNAVVTSLTGNAQVQIGTAAPRVLRVGDELQQGATVSTGTASSLVLKFDDGQIAALTSSSRMTITAYRYDAKAGTGNVLLSLLDGGMRAITGLIGRRSPDRVSYRAATATIGIRGTDAIIVTANGNVVVSVVEGAISFTFHGQTIIIPAGQGVNARTDGTFQQAAAAQILSQISPDLAAMINGLTGLSNAIQQAAAGTPRGRGDQDDQGDRGDRGDDRGHETQGPNNPPGGGGGGSASQR